MYNLIGKYYYFNNRDKPLKIKNIINSMIIFEDDSIISKNKINMYNINDNDVINPEDFFKPRVPTITESNNSNSSYESLVTEESSSTENTLEKFKDNVDLSNRPYFLKESNTDDRDYDDDEPEIVYPTQQQSYPIPQQNVPQQNVPRQNDVAVKPELLLFNKVKRDNKITITLKFDKFIPKQSVIDTMNDMFEYSIIDYLVDSITNDILFDRFEVSKQVRQQLTKSKKPKKTNDSE